MHRWPVAAPKLIIYDFACALSVYCYNRDPGYFEDTVFQVDKLHSKNHSCGKSYHMKHNPYYDHINSQANEQYNSDLQRLHSQLSYMTPKNFMTHLRLYLTLRNMRKQQKE